MLQHDRLENVSKHLNSGLHIVEIASYIAAGVFNEGNWTILQIMQEMGIVIGHQSRDYAKKVDEIRKYHSRRKSSLATKEARTARLEQSMKENEFFEETEGIFYAPGMDN